MLKNCVREVNCQEKKKNDHHQLHDYSVDSSAEDCNGEQEELNKNKKELLPSRP